MTETEHQQLDELARRFTARCYLLLWVLVMAVMCGWTYFKMTGPAL